MAPMVATAAEAAVFVDRCRAAGLPTAGVMAEVPAARCAPTHSLGPSTSSASARTNDLSQCTYAADRQVGELAKLLDPWQPALLALIAACGEAGRRPACPGGQLGRRPGQKVISGSPKKSEMKLTKKKPKTPR
jgi:phosphoenolpyruvate-protein phosphotransferase (PTS system enzyme I)